MANLAITVAELNKMKAFDVLDNESIKTRFIDHHKKFHDCDIEDSEMFYESEKYNFQKLLSNSKDLKDCTGFSIYGVMMDVAAMGLTITPDTKPLLYVLSRSVNAIGEKRAYIQISPYGELALRIQAGQILYADRPVVVYEGDEFQPGMNEYGRKFVKYMAAVPRKSKNIIGSFIGLTRPDNSIDFFWMMDEEIERLKKASNKQNKGDASGNKANALYTANDGQIDIGFLEAKTLKHSLMTFPKIKIGQFTTLQQFSDEPLAADYGFSQADMLEVKKQKADTEAFAAEQQTEEPETVSVEDESDIF